MRNPQELSEVPDDAQTALSILSPLDTLVIFCKACNQLDCPVVRRIIPDEEIPIVDGLSLNTFYLLFDKPSPVIRSQQNDNAHTITQAILSPLPLRDGPTGTAHLSGGVVAPFLVRPCQVAFLIVVTDHCSQTMHRAQPWRRAMPGEPLVGRSKIRIQQSNFARKKQRILYLMLDLIEQ